MGYTQLAAKIIQERLHNPTRTLLLSSGDNIQGDAMMYFFKSAALGYTADGTPLDPSLQTNPLIRAFNSMNYDAYTLGNHEFNFGSEIFTSTLAQATFPVLQANLEDNGQYGIAEVPVEDYVEKVVGPEGINVAILGIGNHRVPNYELPSNIPGLSFTNPIEKAQELSDALRESNDVVLALTHIGFTENPGSVEIDNNVDTYMAANVTGLDVIVGGHSHTNPAYRLWRLQVPADHRRKPKQYTGADQPCLSLQQYPGRSDPGYAPRREWGLRSSQPRRTVHHDRVNGSGRCRDTSYCCALCVSTGCLQQHRPRPDGMAHRCSAGFHSGNQWCQPAG